MVVVAWDRPVPVWRIGGLGLIPPGKFLSFFFWKTSLNRPKKVVLVLVCVPPMGAKKGTSRCPLLWKAIKRYRAERIHYVCIAKESCNLQHGHVEGVLTSLTKSLGRVMRTNSNTNSAQPGQFCIFLNQELKVCFASVVTHRPLNLN